MSHAHNLSQCATHPLRCASISFKALVLYGQEHGLA